MGNTDSMSEFIAAYFHTESSLQMESDLMFPFPPSE
jgi:hypothetical protein